MLIWGSAASVWPLWDWAAILGADVVVGAELPNTFGNRRTQPFLNQLANHPYERWVNAGGCGPAHSNTQFITQNFGFVIEVVQDLHVIR